MDNLLKTELRAADRQGAMSDVALAANSLLSGGQTV